jgi:hypothetical protein
VVNGDNEDKAPSTRSGLCDLFNRANEASKLLVISRVSNEKVLPWIISSSGAVRCFDTISLSQKLSLHRLAVRPILHLLAWERLNSPAERTIFSPKLPASSMLPQLHQDCMESIEPRTDAEEAYVGDLSFRLDDLSFESSWVWLQFSVFGTLAPDVHMYVLIFSSSPGLYAQFCDADMQIPAKCLWLCGFLAELTKEGAFIITLEGHVVMKYLCCSQQWKNFHRLTYLC